MKICAAAIATLVAMTAVAQSPAAQTKAKQPNPDFERVVAPFKIVGNLYFVGTSDLGIYLITSPQGHILIDTGFERTVPIIRASVEKLGFKFTDIKIILGSHAHGDHREGDALAKELTGAPVYSMEQDIPALKLMMPGGKAHPIDHVLHDGDQVKLGSNVLTAHLTPGHTKGCTTWTMKATEAGKTYNVVDVCSANIVAPLVNNSDYPQIAEDYVRTFAILRTLPADIFIAAHPSHAGMETVCAYRPATYEYCRYYHATKEAKMKLSPPNRFLNHDGYVAYIDLKETQFKERLAQQKSEAKQ